MRKMRIAWGVVFILVASLGSAQASKLVAGRKGVGFAKALGGPAGLAFNYGVGNLAIEGIFGWDAVVPKKGDNLHTIAIGVGGHFFSLRAENAALAFGARFNIAFGKVLDPTAPPATPKYNDVTDIGVDLPLRIYWFADEHFSLHFESGLSLDIGPKDGNLIGLGAPADGTRWTLFGNLDSNAYGFMGGTFWW